MISSKKKLLVIFFMALIIRGILFVHVIGHPQVILQPDSRMYVSLAQGLLQHGTFCYPDRPGQPDVERMPGYPLFLALVLWLSGESLLAVLVLQIILDSFSCVLIYYLGEMIQEGVGFLSGVLACFNMGMITYSHFILNDNLFLLIFLVLLVGIFRFLREPEWKTGILLGAGIGIATLIRPVIVYLPLFLIPLFFVYFITKLNITLLVASGKAILVGLIFVLFLSPWLIRNYIHYERIKLTAQSGGYLLQYIVPFVWQYSKGIPFIKGMKRTSREFQEKAEREGFDYKKADVFEVSDFQTGMAIEYLKKEPKIAIIKAWAFGMAKNLFAPAIIDLSYLLNIERPHFFYTEGKTLIDRAWNFIRNMKGFFGWAVIGSLVAMIIFRSLQLWGLILSVWHRRWEGILLFLIPFYFLFISGPVGYAKYRLPFEPLLIVLMAIGIKSLARFYKTRLCRSIVHEVDAA